MTRGFSRRALAATLILTTFLAVTAFPVLAVDGASLSGRIVAADGVTPRAGVVVALFDEQSRTTYRSDPSSTEGAFNIAEAPAGSYRMLAETSEGAYLASNQFQLEPGQNRPVSLSLDPQTDPTGDEGGAGGEGDPAADEQAAKKDGLPTWARWVIAGAILVGGVLVIEELTKEEEPASPFR